MTTIAPDTLIQVQDVDDRWHAAAVGPDVLCQRTTADLAAPAVQTVAWDDGHRCRRLPHMPPADGRPPVAPAPPSGGAGRMTSQPCDQQRPLNLAAIRERDDERPSSYISWWGVMAVEDRRLLLREVDRLAKVLAVAERERDEAGQSSLNRLAQNIDLRTALTAERAKVAEAWEKGLSAGCDRWCDSREFGDPPVNPYRTALAEGAADQPPSEPAVIDEAHLAHQPAAEKGEQ